MFHLDRVGVKSLKYKRKMSKPPNESIYYELLPWA